MRYFTFTILGIVLTSHLVARASSNRDYEDWLHNIYVGFYQKAVSSQNWKKVLSRQNSDNYTVKPGDNLSQISANILGSSTYWPKLWAVNSQLSNPHLIAENSQLSINANGDLSFSPAPKQIRQHIIVKFKKRTKEDKIITETKRVVLPQPKAKLHSVLKSFPASFPNWTAIYHQSQTDRLNNLAIEFVEPALASYIPSVHLDSMIIESRPNVIGTVLASERKLLYSKGQNIFIKVFGDVTIELGQLLRVVDIKQVYFKNRSVAEGLLRVKAELKVIEVVDNTEEAFYKEYKVRIKHSFFSVTAGDSIIDGSVNKFSIRDVSSSKELSSLGLIIGGKALSSPEFFGLHSLVYLNVGSKESLKIGDTFPIYQNLQSRGGRQRWGDKAAAYINIIDVKENTATAVISKIISDIKVGDRVGSFDQVSDLESTIKKRDWLDIESSDEEEQGFSSSDEEEQGPSSSDEEDLESGDLEEDLEEELDL